MRFKLVEEVQQNKIILFHGTPHRSAAINIAKNGLFWSPDNISTGGIDTMKCIDGRSYLTTDPDTAEIYATYLTKEREDYGYIFVFKVDKKDLLPDEDCVYEQIIAYYCDNNDLPFRKELLNIFTEDEINAIKDGYDITAYDKIKEITAKLTVEECEKLVDLSDTVSTEKILYPVAVYKQKRLIKNKDDLDNLSMEDQLKLETQAESSEYAPKRISFNDI